MKLRAGQQADSGASAFAKFFGKGKAEGDKPAEEDKPEGADTGEGEEDPDEEDGEGEPTPQPDDDEETKDASSAAAQARARERGRVAAILGHEAAAKQPAVALHLALETDMPRAQAIGVLVAAAKNAVGTGLGARMAGVKDIALGAGDVKGGDRKAQLASGWDKAFAAAGIATTPKA